MPRSAGPISLEAIKTANRSNASSIALLRNVRAVASNVADRRTRRQPPQVNASPVNPARASASTLPGGTSATSTRSAPKPAISAARSNARTISRPEARVGARRSRSNSDTRDPDGTVSNLFQPLTEFRRPPPRQPRVETLRHVRPDLGHQSGQHTDPGQKHLTNLACSGLGSATSASVFQCR
jgi:hypothetical protein